MIRQKRYKIEAMLPQGHTAPHSGHGTPFFPCTVGVENVAQGFPHFLPGQNPYVNDAAKKQRLPIEAIKGGAETMYPEYREKLKTLPVPAAD